MDPKRGLLIQRKKKIWISVCMKIKL